VEGGKVVTEEYGAAVEAVAVFSRGERRIFQISGRDPEGMLKGVVSGRIPGEPSAGSGNDRIGEVCYNTLLTPKARMITDLRILRGPAGGFLLDLPKSGSQAALRHLQKYLPPRLARVADRSEDFAMLSLVGRGVGAVLTTRLGVDPPTAETLETLEEGQELSMPLADVQDVRVVRNGDVWPPAFDLLLPSDAVGAMMSRVVEGGAVAGSWHTWEVLRIENGRPAFGVDMDGETIPVEAGIDARAIDHGKGCYTGQETIVRIRDRGRVNKRLRGFLLAEGPPPTPGTELYSPATEKSAGWVTSACASPRFQQTIALGYVRRAAEEEERLSLGSPSGPPVEVREVGDGGWV
jgi:folate-binding protein YgfZ